MHAQRKHSVRKASLIISKVGKISCKLKAAADREDKSRHAWPFRIKSGTMPTWPIAGVLASDLLRVFSI